MVEIKKGENGRGGNSFNTSKNTPSKKKIIFGVIFVIIILILVSVVFFINKFSAVGQAVHTEVQAPLSLPSGGSAVVWTEFVLATAAEGDIIHIPIHLKTDTGIKVDKFTFNVVYDKTKFSLDATSLGANLPTASGGFQFMGTPQEVLTDIINDQQIDLIALSQGVGGNDVVIANIAFKVIGKANAPFTAGLAGKITFNFVNAGYLNSGVPVVVSLNPAMMDVTITIYPACQDADGDGYGASASDLRGCVHNLPADVDCDDVSSDDLEICQSNVNCNDVTYAGCAKCVNPGAKEVCDGINNDCSSVIDDSVGDGGYNLNLNGVCYGYKICMGKDGWKNSYEVNDKTLNTQMFGDGSKEFSQVDLYVPFKVDGNGKLIGEGDEKCDVFDNNCDGNVNEGITCSLSGGGGIPKGLLPVGNVYLNYKNDVLDQQVINNLDLSLLTIYQESLGSVNFGNGTKGQIPYQSFLKSSLVWMCDDGVYYLNTTAGVYKNFYNNENREKLTNPEITINNDLKNNGVEIKC